jgi:hypothetical protein
MGLRRRTRLANLRAADCATHFANGSSPPRKDTMQPLKRPEVQAFFRVFSFWPCQYNGMAHQLLESEAKSSRTRACSRHPGLPELETDRQVNDCNSAATRSADIRIRSLTQVHLKGLMFSVPSSVTKNGAQFASTVV